MSSYDKAIHARNLYRIGRITKREALDLMGEYIDEFNAKSRELARKYGVRPKLFNFEAFCR